MTEDRTDDRSEHASTSEIVVVLVDAETPGNVGTVARAMKNFGLSDLLLVDPPELDPDGEAYGFAGSARNDVLPNARTVDFEDVVDSYHTVGCTAIPNEDPTNHVRYPVSTPQELADRIQDVGGETALLFGRERVGLTNDELARLDEICSIPASNDYPVLNLGQAATVVLYELRNLTVPETQLPDLTHERAPADEVERLHDQFAEFLVALDHPEEKRAKAGRMFRRLLGRADPTPREVSTLHGLLRRASERAEPDRGSETTDDRR